MSEGSGNELVRRIQRAYPQLYLACHVEHTTRRRAHGLSDRDASVLAHLDELSPVHAGALAKHLGVGPSTVTEAVTRIADAKLPFGGRWIYELAADGAGTRLTITEDGFVKNPIFRLLSKTVFSQSATIERFLVDLGGYLGVPVTINAPRSARLPASAS